MEGEVLGRAKTDRGAMLALALATLLSSLGVSMANVALPVFAEQFSAPFASVQWVVIAYLLASTTLVVGAGRLGDLVGRARLLQGGIALFTGASALCLLVPSLPVLIAARVLQGAGGAAMMAMALVQSVVARDRTGQAMGLMGTMSALGTALGPSVGGFILGVAGWRALFGLVLPLGLIALWVVRRSLRALTGLALSLAPSAAHLAAVAQADPSAKCRACRGATAGREATLSASALTFGQCAASQARSVHSTRFQI